jgi:hypothetical protein
MPTPCEGKPVSGELWEGYSMPSVIGVGNHVTLKTKSQKAKAKMKKL